MAGSLRPSGMHPPRPAVFAAVGSLVAALAGCSGQPPRPADTLVAAVGSPAPIDGPYYSLLDDRSLSVVVPVGGGCQVTGTASVGVTESAEKVVLHAAVARPPAPSPPPSPPGEVTGCTSDLILQRVDVALSGPLDGRRVVDGWRELTLELQPAPPG